MPGCDQACGIGRSRLESQCWRAQGKADGDIIEVSIESLANEVTLKTSDERLSVSMMW